ncbi:MAG: endonuclease NucS [Candidatus Diapherotrites archaeon]|nr:endonuclease NucS [Candidatus Diapherotrites archaeon]
MELEQAKQRLAESVSRKEMSMIIGTCYVEYWGRAASKLAKGKRMVLIKGDHSVSIHQNKLVRPVNYMMNADIYCEIENETLILHANKKKPKETLKIIFYKIDGLHAYEIEENADLRLFGSERELSKELMQDLSFIEPGLKPVNQEIPFRKGIVDILAEDQEGNLVVIEVKRRKADFNSVTQLERYMKQVEKIKGKKTRGMLLAPSIQKSALELLEQAGLEFAKFEFEIGNPKATIKGIQKKQKLLNEFF